MARRSSSARVPALMLTMLLAGCGSRQIVTPVPTQATNGATGDQSTTPATDPAGVPGTIPYGADPARTGEMPGPGVPDAPVALWRTSLGGGVAGSPIVAGGQVIVGANDGLLYALDFDTGAILWTFQVGGGITRPAAVAEDVVFVAGTDHVLHAVDLVTHQERWRYAGASTNAIPTVVGQLVLIGSVDHAVVALDQATGAERWRLPVVGTATSAAVAGDIAYVGGDLDGQIYAIDTRTGALLWSYQSGATGMLTPALFDGTLYVSAQDPPGRNAQLVALDATTGAVRWRYVTPDGVRTGTLAVDGARVYTETGAAQPVVLALDRATGALAWQAPIAGFGSPALVDGVLYESSEGGDIVRAIDAATGTTRWSYVTGAPVDDEVVVANGTILFGAGRGPDGHGSVGALVAGGDPRLGGTTAVASPKSAPLPVRFVSSFHADTKPSLYLDLDVSPDGDVYVVDVNNNRVLVFGPDGTFRHTVGTSGDGPGQFDFCVAPCDVGGGSIAFAPDGTFVVSEVMNHRVQRFGADGTFLGQFGRFGRQSGQFITPTGIAVDSKGLIYVSDADRNDIQVFSPSGEYLRTMGSAGSGPSQFSGPTKPSFDQADNLYVSDYGNDRIEKFDPTGKFLSSYTGDPSSGFSVRQPNFALVDTKGRMFLTDTGGNGGANGLVVVDQSGKVLAVIGTTVDGHYIDGNGLAFGPNGLLYEITNSFANGADPADRISVLQLLPPLWP